MGVAVRCHPGRMAEVFLHGADIDAGADELGPAKMAKVVEADLDPEAMGEAPKGLADRVGLGGCGAARVEAPSASASGQDVSIRQRLDTGVRRPGLDSLP